MRLVLRRIPLWILSLIILSWCIFVIMRLLPADTARIMAGVNATDSQVRLLRQQLGLDKPWIVQYAAWLGQLIHGNLGVSLIAGRSVASVLSQRLIITFPIMIFSLTFAIVLGIPLGVAVVCVRSKGLQSFLRLVSLTAASIPALWLGLLLIAIFARSVGFIPLFPSQGFPAQGWANFPQSIAAIILPSLTVGIIVASSLMRYTARCLTDVSHSPVIEYACACGLSRTSALIRVGLRIIFPQLVSVVGLTFAHLATGVLVVENLFALPGIGFGLVTDVGSRDVISVQSELIVLAIFFLTLGFVVDIAHRLSDPRLRIEAKAGA